MKHLLLFITSAFIADASASYARERIANDGLDNISRFSEQEEPTDYVSMQADQPLIPLTNESLDDIAAADGCWATVYSQENYEGNSLTLVGPHNLNTLSFPSGENWQGRINSIEVGYTATAKLYQGPYFSDPLVSVYPADALPKIEQKPFWGTIESLRLTCD